MHLLPEPLQFVLPLAQRLVLHGQELEGGGQRVHGDIGVGAPVHQVQESQPYQIVDGGRRLRLGDTEIPYAPFDVDVLAS